jgi:hypothetical protein
MPAKKVLGDGKGLEKGGSGFWEACLCRIFGRRKGEGEGWVLNF